MTFSRKARVALPKPVAPAMPAARPESGTRALAAILIVGLLVRLLFIGADGFKNDVEAFESWALTLSQHPLAEFYAKAGFADYPPGYFYVLWIVGNAYRVLIHADPTYALLKMAVKLPAILFDLVDAALLFALIRRSASVPWALLGAALFAFNPAAIYISAYWGQVDSVAAAFLLGALYLLTSTSGFHNRDAVLRIAAAWACVAYSILIKPPAVVIVPLMFAFVWTAADAREGAARRRGTAIGVALGLTLAYGLVLPFHPNVSPVGAFAWLIGRYAYASNVYPYNSVNAFNLYAMGHPFWQPDSLRIPALIIGGREVGLPQYLWGIVLFVSASVLVVLRYLDRRTPAALLEGAMILSLGFFILSTRMHERYIFNAVVLCIPLVAYARRYVYATILLTMTLCSNLAYSFYYLTVALHQTPGLDGTNLLPGVSRPLSIVNVLAFFALGYRYLGAHADEARASTRTFTARFPALAQALRARAWFAPGEGLCAMTRRDYALALGFIVASIAVTLPWFWLPAGKVFDEIYYARAAEEYLKHVEIFEYTHPPLTKLIITASTRMLGDHAAGWRFLNLIVGALSVGVIYAFAKRLTASTLFASVAAGLLLFDGFHFVQSRIATPEITVAFFSLTTLYAFYRLWIASQVRVAPLVTRRAVGIESGVFIAAFAAIALLVTLFGGSLSFATRIVVTVYAALGMYLAIRLLLPRFLKLESVVSYPEGTSVSADVMHTADGGVVPARGALRPGESTTTVSTGLVYAADDMTVTYGRDGTLEYVTPGGSMRAEASGRLSAGNLRGPGRHEATMWFGLLTLSSGALAASKWNGLFDFFVIWLLAVAVALQPFAARTFRAAGLARARRPALYGNPRGISVDILVAGMLFVSATIYTLTYIPYFSLGHGLSDLVALQKGMYDYHHNLRATHPYSSEWWQWPLLLVPIAYAYADLRHGAAATQSHACCVTEILALPNPVVWWLGLISVPFVAWLAWRERNKGYVLLVTAYVIQWLPWIGSPRIAFEYHFYPNLAIIVLSDAILLQRVWHAVSPSMRKWSWPRLAVAGYLIAVCGAFIFWYPVLANTPLRWDDWNLRMLTPVMHYNWINPHPAKGT